MTDEKVKGRRRRELKMVSMQPPVMPEVSDNEIDLPKKKTRATRKEEPQLKNKWSGTVIEHGWTGVPNMLIESQQALELKPLDMNILFILLKHWWEPDKHPFPSKKTIGEITGKDESTVRRSVASMESKDLIKRVKRLKKSGGQDSNGYDLSGLVTKLQELSKDRSELLKQRDEEDGKRRRGR